MQRIYSQQVLKTSLQIQAKKTLRDKNDSQHAVKYFLWAFHRSGSGRRDSLPMKDLDVCPVIILFGSISPGFVVRVSGYDKDSSKSCICSLSSFSFCFILNSSGDSVSFKKVSATPMSCGVTLTSILSKLWGSYDNFYASNVNEGFYYLKIHSSKLYQKQNKNPGVSANTNKQPTRNSCYLVNELEDY